MADERKRRRWPWVVLALLVLYPLSTGPMTWLWAHGYLSTDTALSIRYSFYRPLFWLAGHSELLNAAIDRYVSLWLASEP